jgi:hypothetical protein
MCGVLAWRRRGRRGPCLGLLGGAPPKYHLVYTPPSGQPRRPPSSQQWSHRPPRKVAPRPPVYPRSTAPPRVPQPAGVEFLCFNCDQIGHFSRECPQPQQGFTPRVSPPPIGQPKATVHPPSPRVGRANFTMLEEIPPGEEVLTGMFYLYDYPINILFDSGASHDFLSLACARKAELNLCATPTPYCISTPGGRVVANQMVHKISLELAGRVFPTTLVPLEGQGIDVILGMKWMKMHRAVLDISARLVHLNSPIYGKVSLQLSYVAHLQASVYAAVAKSLDEIPVVRKYLDVFPNDLLRMPPNRDIKFKIELQPGTAPIYKPPYPMAQNEMV